MIKKITLIFIALYPIMPDYFRLLSLPSGAVVACLFFALSCLNKDRLFTVRKKDAITCGIPTALMCIPYIFHGEYSTAVKCIIEYMFVFLLLCRYFTTKARVIEALDILVTVSVVMCFFGMFEFATGRSLFEGLYSGVSTDLSPALQMRGPFARSEATFGHSITYAIYLSICALTDSVFIIKTRKKKYKFYYIVLVATLFMTISRAPIILFVFGQLLLLYMFGFDKFIKTLFKAIICLGFAFAIVSAFMPSIFSTVQYMFNIVLAIFSENAALQVGSIQNANPFEYRLELLSVIPQYIRQAWLFGRGSSTSFEFQMLGHTYYSIDNAYLVWLFKYGLFGLLGNLIYFIDIFIFGCKQGKKDGFMKLFFVIAIIYFLNLFSVAQMSEYKLWIIMVSIAYNLYRLNHKQVD